MLFSLFKISFDVLHFSADSPRASRIFFHLYINFTHYFSLLAFWISSVFIFSFIPNFNLKF